MERDPLVDDAASRRLGVLVVSEDPAVALAVEQRLRGLHQVRVAMSAQKALVEIKREPPDVVVCDQAIAPVTADELFEIIATFFPKVRRVLQVEWRLGSGLGPTMKGLLERGLAEAVVDRAASLEHLLAAIRPA